MVSMQPLKARVRNGRLVLDEPTDLPEGAVVYLERVDDGLDDEGRAALHRELEASIAEADSGQTDDLSDVIADLRARS